MNWLKYNNFPCYNLENGSGGPAAAPALAVEPTVPAVDSGPQVPADLESVTNAEIAEGEQFVLDFFEPLSADLEDDDFQPAAPAPTPVVPASPAPAVTPEVVPTAPAAQPQVTAPVQTPAPVTAPAPTPAAPAVAVTPTAQPPSAPAPSAPQPVVTPAVATGVHADSFDQIAEGLIKQKGEFINALAEQQYKLTDEELEELSTNPSLGYAKLAARAQVEATTSVLKVVSQRLPAVIHGLIQARDRNQESENLFWDSNKHLDRTKHRGVVAEVMQRLRAVSPDMPATDFIREVGMYAGMKAGVSAVPQAAAQVPQQQVVHTPGPVVRTAVPGGFVPAGVSAAPASAHPKPQLSEAERFFEMFKLDESGAFE